jgi:hypothetical protein
MIYLAEKSWVGLIKANRFLEYFQKFVLTLWRGVVD